MPCILVFLEAQWKFETNLCNSLQLVGNEFRKITVKSLLVEFAENHVFQLIDGKFLPSEFVRSPDCLNWSFPSRKISWNVTQKIPAAQLQGYIGLVQRSGHIEPIDPPPCFHEIRFWERSDFGPAAGENFGSIWGVTKGETLQKGTPQAEIFVVFWALLRGECFKKVRRRRKILGYSVHYYRAIPNRYPPLVDDFGEIQKSGNFPK